jgi:hypothetical protein
MSGHTGGRLARAASILAAVAVLCLSAGCQATCREGDYSRFRCDPTTASTPPAARPDQPG